jgi:dienelactone hydrolase
LVERLADGGNVFMRRYPRARHGFDNPELPALLAIDNGFTLGFGLQAAANAWDEIDEFLTR